MITYATALEVFNRNCGSQNLYKRSYCNTLVYTDGVMDFQQTLNAFWFVDNVISYMPDVIKDYHITKDYFYVVELSLNKNHKGQIIVYREGYIDGNYQECIPVIKQKIPYIDLPVDVKEKATKYSFFLELSNAEKTEFTLMLPLEH